MQRRGTSQQGSPATRVSLQSSVSSVSEFSTHDRSERRTQLHESLTMPCCSSTSLPSERVAGIRKLPSIRNLLEVKWSRRRIFFPEELKHATNNFDRKMLIGEGGHSKVYLGILHGGQAAAAKVLNNSQQSEEDLFRGVEMLSGLNHENIIQLIGHSYCKDLQVVVYILLKSVAKT